MAPKAKAPQPPLNDVLDNVEGELLGSLDDLVRVHLPMLPPAEKDFVCGLIFNVARPYLVKLHLRKQAHGGKHQARKRVAVASFKKAYTQTLADMRQMMQQLTNDSSVAPLLPHLLGDAEAEAALQRLLVSFHAFDDEARGFIPFIKFTEGTVHRTIAPRDAAIQELYMVCHVRWKTIYPTVKKDKFFKVVKVFLLATSGQDDCPDSDVRLAVRSAGL